MSGEPVSREEVHGIGRIQRYRVDSNALSNASTTSQGKSTTKEMPANDSSTGRRSVIAITSSVGGRLATLGVRDGDRPISIDFSGAIAFARRDLYWLSHRQPFHCSIAHCVV